MGIRFSNPKSVVNENKFEVMDNKTATTNNTDVSGDQDYQVSVLLDVNGNNQCIINSSDKPQSSGHTGLLSTVEKENIINSLRPENNSIRCGCSVNSIKSESNKGRQLVDDKSAKYKIGKKRSHKLFFSMKDANIKKKNHWVLNFNCSRLKGGNSNSRNEPSTSSANTSTPNNTCVCTDYRSSEAYVPSISDEDDMSLVPLLQHQDDDDDDDDDNESGEYSEFGNSASISDTVATTLESNAEPVIDLSKFNADDYPIEDCDERARLERAREIAEGVEPPPGFNSNHRIQLVCPTDLSIDNLTALFRSALSLSTLSQIDTPRPVHTQIDYIHCLVPDLLQITCCSFYWGKIDRYEAERLLDNKPEGTFLLRDSAQEEYLFSVSFRKYGRSLHARIEQWNHRFSFDSHDPGVFASSTVCGLIEHYKDPTCCMFFEPMLTIPLNRTYPFNLQHLCRALICNHVTYDSINLLKLPKKLKSYLKEYHYKQRVRVRKFEADP